MSCCQQGTLYASEVGLERGREFSSSAELQQFVDGLRENAWWARFYPQVLRVEAGFVNTGKGSVGGWFPDRGAGRIEMGPGHRNMLIVCHELAHVLAKARYGSQAHCPWFARVYLELVFFIMGEQASSDLAAAFQRCGVDYTPERQDFEYGRSRFELEPAS